MLLQADKNLGNFLTFLVNGFHYSDHKLSGIELQVNCIYTCLKCFPGGSLVKKLPGNAGDVVSILGLGRSPGEENGNPF